MCGIAGSTRDPQGHDAAAMARALIHRGPDDEGYYRDDTISLAVRRLSIIDVGGGRQPARSEDGSVIALLNGEIYNFQSLQDHLLQRGHVLASGSDTEVLVHMYEEYGDELVHGLEGMFAFAIWDKRRQRLLLARDRFGEKPLYYRESSGDLSFASELSALTAADTTAPVVEPRALDAFFVYGYIPAAIPVVQGVSALRPAHRLIWESGAAGVRLDRYWSPPSTVAEAVDSINDLEAETERLLTKSVASRMVADRSVGVLLSGGVDSTLLAAVAARTSSHRIKTFTVGYDTGGVNETSTARATARTLGSEHHEVIVGLPAVEDLVMDMFRRVDVPIADQALVALHALCGYARDHATVAVGGEGADELFGGYPRYRALRRAEQILDRVGPPELLARRASTMLAGARVGGRTARVAGLIAARSTVDRHVDWVTQGRRAMRPSVYGTNLIPAAANGTMLTDLSRIVTESDRPLAATDMMRLDQLHWLPDDVLAKADRAGMLASVEIRTPYLNRELAEFAASLPSSAHTSGGGKVLLRRLLGKLLPEDHAPRPKKGFSVPAAEWLRGPLRDQMRQQIAGGGLYNDGWFDRNALANLEREHSQGRADHARVLWPALALGVWYDGVTGHVA